MRFEVVHTTRYRYSAPVFLEPHTLRFRPRSNSWQRLVSFDLHVEPRPAGATDTLDLEANDVQVAWFEGLTDHLSIEARSVVETLRGNPFDFLVLGNTSLPMRYSEAAMPSLRLYLQHQSVSELRRYAEVVASGAGSDALSFLVHLARLLHDGCRHIVRPEGDPFPPEETLRRREGACRDLAVLYVALCREQGLAARFVSGYCAAEGAEEDELHAWAEVYLPGGGWRGFDPSMGLVVAGRHIAIAAGATPADAAPVSGSLRGDATSRIETALKITCLD